MTTWRELLEEALEDRGEKLADLEANTLTDEDMEREFYDGYGSLSGHHIAFNIQQLIFICRNSAGNNMHVVLIRAHLSPWFCPRRLCTR